MVEVEDEVSGPKPPITFNQAVGLNFPHEGAAEFEGQGLQLQACWVLNGKHLMKNFISSDRPKAGFQRLWLSYLLLVCETKILYTK